MTSIQRPIGANVDHSVPIGLDHARRPSASDRRRRPSVRTPRVHAPVQPARRWLVDLNQRHPVPVTRAKVCTRHAPTAMRRSTRAASAPGPARAGSCALLHNQVAGSIPILWCAYTGRPLPRGRHSPRGSPRHEFANCFSSARGYISSARASRNSRNRSWYWYVGWGAQPRRLMNSCRR